MDDNLVVSPSLTAGRRVGAYELLACVGAGASSEVWTAHRPGQERVALKILTSTTPQGVAGMLAELSILSRVQHPNVVKILDFGRIDDGPQAGRVYLVSDELPGSSPGSVFCVPATAGDDDPSRLRFWLQLARELLDALTYLHARCIRHGDLSPDNIRFGADGRAVLVDFGLAQISGPGAVSQPDPRFGVSGTLGFVAPEALFDGPSFSSELFSLGACLYAAWTGQAPFGTGFDSISRIERQDLSPLKPDLPNPFRDWLLRLLALSPQGRPASAAEAYREFLILRAGPAASAELDLLPPAPTGDPVAGLFVGRKAEVARLVDELARLQGGQATRLTLAIVGPPGSGRRTLIHRALSLARTAAIVTRVPAFTLLHQREPIGSAAAAANLVDSWEAQADDNPLCVLVDPGPDAALLVRLVAQVPLSGRLLVLWSASLQDDVGADAIVLPPLGRHEIERLAAAALSQADAPSRAVDTILRLSGGHAAIVAVLVRQLVETARAGDPTSFTPAIQSSELGTVLAAACLALPPDLGLVLASLVLLSADNRSVPLDDVARFASQDAHDVRRSLLILQSKGWAIPCDPGTWTTASSVHREAALAALLRSPLYADLIAKAFDQIPPSDGRHALLLLADLRPVSPGLWASAARLSFTEGRCAVAIDCWMRGFQADERSVPENDRLDLVEGLTTFGRLEEARLVMRAESADPKRPDDAALERRAWILGRLGQLPIARDELEQALSKRGAPAKDRPLVRARLSRVLVSLGDFQTALTYARPLLGEGGRAAVLARESAILACAYSGRIDEAETFLAAGVGAGSPGKDAALRGLLAQLKGEITVAAEAFSVAVSAFERAGERPATATARFNLGCALADAGRYADAVRTLERAITELGRVGTPQEQFVATFDLGLLMLRLGDLAAARRMLDRLSLIAPGSSGSSAGHILCLQADLAHREGQSSAALTLYQQAEAAFGAAGADMLRGLTCLSRAEILASQGRHLDASVLVTETITPPVPSGDGWTDAVDLTRARLLLSEDAASQDPAQVVTQAKALTALSSRSLSRGALPLGWRAATLAAGLWDRAHDPQAATSTDVATKLLSRIKDQSDPRHFEGFSRDPDARYLPQPVGQTTEGVAQLAVRAERAESRLRRLVRINKRLNSELRLPRVLETIIDTVIELCDAERGFLLLKDEQGDLTVKIARNIDAQSLDRPEFELSRSIARQVAAGGVPIVTVDANIDDRFRAALSVSDLHLRSVLAAPLAVKGRVVGVIYVDHRLRRGAFSDDDVALVLDFAEQGALAIENARILSELRRRERQIEALNSRLQTELAARTSELSDLREEAKLGRASASVRYDYQRIIGKTPRMVELFQLLDRVTDTALPVVLQGESGTGKELVARAIHVNGPRRDRPFVSENCAAIPESLLESTLFGYTRGAFTGAERDTRGLFSIADGGTLFLDEVGEMSLGMQAKILRVLQEGELRRVGSERGEKVDVRIITATNRDLQQLVSQKKFRQDLYYRLAVVRVELPPLRERKEDIPLLVEHFSRRQAEIAKKPVPMVDPAAMAKLMAHRWVGNVRELENEITRATAFAGDRITVADLSPELAASFDDALETVAGQDLRIKPRVQRLERALVREALGQHEGNQTRAAEALGLSRFGLQKKLQRYKMVSG